MFCLSLLSAGNFLRICVDSVRYFIRVVMQVLLHFAIFTSISLHYAFIHRGYLFFSVKKKKNSVYFMLLTLSWRSFIKTQYSSVPFFPHGVPLPHSNVLQYYVKREKFKVIDIIFPSGCEAPAINLGNKNIKIGIFTGATSVRLKKFSTIFLDILPESMK